MKYKYNIAVFRVILAFAVVGGHYSALGFPYNYLSPLAVPCFMTLAFVFFAKHLSEKSWPFLQKRLSRLAIPYFIWPIIYLFAYSGLCALFGVDWLGRDWKNALFFQFLFGHSILTVLWFHWCLILFTVIIWILSFLPRKVFFALLGAAFALSFFCQYSGTNNLFFDLPFELKFPLGRLAEMAPYCVTGCVFGIVCGGGREENISYKASSLICALMLFVFALLHFLPALSAPSDYGYSGLHVYAKSVSLLCFFWFVPIDSFFENHQQAKKIVCFASKYTMGVYCLHIIVGKFVSHFGFSNDVFKCSIIYFACFIICLLVDRLDYKIIKDLVN